MLSGGFGDHATAMSCAGVSKMMNCALETRTSVLKTRNLVFKTRILVFKMMSFAGYLRRSCTCQDHRPGASC